MVSLPLLRSVLILPGSRPELLAKASVSGADALVIDLEDSVAAKGKPAARQLAADALRSRDGTLTFVRFNHPSQGMLRDDLAVLAPHPHQGVMLPKTESADEVQALDAALLDFEQANGLPPHSISALVIVESSRGLRHLFDIACASPRVRGACLASAEEGDLMHDLGGRWTPDGRALAYARGKFVCDGRAVGLRWLLDGAFMNLASPDALEAESQIARIHGFTGKTAIHPRQVDVINAVFSPSAAEVERARRLLEAFHMAEKSGVGAVRFEGMMVDAANAKMAEAIIATAR
jgi:citrate lyase subunit beta/citryl-CoA lyase